ncbi:MAG: hypothetical protein LBJ96_03350 [Holosporaceae bacterium]|jgi:hypothetical protein|nr:hypothetical protein [Holosporaceae bacterium]
MGKIMKCIKITLLHAFFAFGCLGMRTAEDDAYKARAEQVLGNFMAIINKNSLIDRLWPQDGGESVEATIEEQQIMGRMIRKLLSLRERADDAAPVNAAINANDATTDGATIKVTKDAITAAIEKIDVNRAAIKAAIEADDRAIRLNLLNAICADKKAGISHTLDLFEKLIDGLVRRNIPLLVTLNSFKRFWTNLNPEGQREDICYRCCMVRNGKPYLAFLIILVENKEEFRSELAFKDGCFGDIVRSVRDGLYHESFHANAFCWQYPSHFYLPTLKLDVHNLQRIAELLGISAEFLLETWHDDAELHCIAGIFLNSQGEVEFDPLCENSRMIKINGGIFLGHVSSPILREISFIPNPTLGSIVRGKKLTDIRFALHQLEIDGGQRALLETDGFLIQLNEASSSRVLRCANFGYNFLYSFLECRELFPIAKGKLRRRLMQRISHPDSKVIVQK